MMNYKPRPLTEAGSSGGKVRIPIVLEGLKAAPLNYAEMTPLDALELAAKITTAARVALRGQIHAADELARMAGEDGM